MKDHSKVQTKVAFVFGLNDGSNNVASKQSSSLDTENYALQVVVIGGASPACFGKVYIYSFETGLWRQIQSLNPPRHSVGAALFTRVDGSKAVLACAGNNGGIVYNTCQILDLETETWSNTASYPLVCSIMYLIPDSF